MKRYLLIILTLFVLLATVLAGDWMVGRHVTMPDEIWAIARDHRGLVWMGTSTGLHSYDGYEVRDWTRGPQLGTGVNSIAEDSAGNLWLGTCDGLVRMDLGTGRLTSFRLPKESQRIIYVLHVSRDGTLYVGTDDGFSIYDAKRNTFHHYNCHNTIATLPDNRRDTVWGFSVKSFLELPCGDLLVGTWADGLLRYSPRHRTFRKYGPLGNTHSAYALARDGKGRIWIGSWTEGLWRLDTPDDYALTTLRHVGSGHNTIYSLFAPDGSSLWAATQEGVAHCDSHGQWQTTRLPVSRRFVTLPARQLWASTLSGRLFGIETAGHPITHHPTGQRVSGLYTVDGKTLRTLTPNGPTAVQQVARLKDGTLVAATEGSLEARHPDGRRDVWTPRDSHWLLDNVYALCPSRSGALWVGQRMGISVVRPDGQGRHIHIPMDAPHLQGYLIVRHLIEDHRGHIWASTSNGGVVRLGGGQVRHYLGSANVTACLEDSRHRLWAIAAHQGLMRYDARSDSFLPVQRAYHLPSRKILAFNEDCDGALWLAMDGLLARLDIGRGGRPHVQLFTSEDGLPEQAFMPRSTLRLGDTLYFGMTDGYIAFSPRELVRHTSAAKAHLIVSDILVDGTSLTEMDAAEASRITPSLPMSVRHLTLPPGVRQLSVECALLSYNHISQTTYAYRLEGRDTTWVYADPGTRRVTLDHLSPGNYKLHLCAIDHRGRQSELAHPIDICVLPPWYATWWARMAYLLVAVLLGWLAWRYVQMRREVEASRRFTAITQTPQLQVPSAPLPQDHPAPQEEPEPSAQPSALLLKATQLVREHLDDSTYNRDRMAADMGMSTSSLFTKLRTASGMNIQTFMQNIRLNAAAALLRAHPDLRISDVAYRVGFNTPKYFSQCFKKEFGVLPGDYAKRYGQGVRE